jgi:hypothetical protein
MIRVGIIFPVGTETILEFDGTHVGVENNGMLYVFKKKTIIAVVHANRWMWVRIEGAGMWL